jgi:hypothetical protein
MVGAFFAVQGFSVGGLSDAVQSFLVFGPVSAVSLGVGGCVWWFSQARRVTMYVVLIALAIGWLGGTFWIRAREPVLTSALPASFPGRVVQVDAHDVRILERGASPAVLLVAGVARASRAGLTPFWSASPLSIASSR